MATITLTVTVSNPGSGNKYYIDGALQATVSMIPGNTYKFDQADNSNSGHPLRLSTTSNGSHNSGSEYTTGVTTSGTPGSSGAYTQIEVTVLTVQSLYYYCTAHSGMGGAINVGNSSTLGLKEMSGFPIQNLTADPVPYAQEISNNPYGGVWSSGGTRNEQAGAIGGTIIGTQTAAVAAGGNISGSVTNKTEEYNGTGWTAGNTLGTARRSSQAAGLESAGLIFGGDTSVNSTGFSNLTETYNGTNWSEANELNTSRGAGSGAGLSTAGVAIGGSTGPGAPNYSGVVENWNGSSWTNGTSVNTARIRGGASGIQTSLLFFGGQASPGASNSVELWNGSSWTETTEINTARGYAGSAGETSTAALFFGGSPSRAITESWNGSSWTEVADLATGQSDNFGVVRGSNISALSSGGESSPNAVSEEWSFSGLPPATPVADYSDAIVGQMYYNSTSGSFKAIKNGGAPIGTWASGGNLGTGRYGMGSFGIQTATLAFAGSAGSAPYTRTNTELYNGTSWSEVNDLNTGVRNCRGAGTTSAGIKVGGDPSNVVETWNGSSWTNVTAMNQSAQTRATFGTSTAAIAAAGNASPTTSVESWNGSSWTEIAEINTGGNGRASGGSPQTDGLVFGSSTSPRGQNESWNGTAWTELSDLNTGASMRGASSTGSTNALAFGGKVNPPVTVNTESWDGSSWTEVANIGSARYSGAYGGSGNTSALFAGGSNPPTFNISATEEWSADDFEIKTLTTS